MPTFALAGKLTREYLLPPAGQPRLDAPGGDLLYAAGGLAVWDSSIALMSQVTRAYPAEWIEDLQGRGWDVSGIHTGADDSADLRSFIAYNDAGERGSGNIVSQFARRGMTFPKSLLGYQPPVDSANPLREIGPLSPAALRAPKDYRKIRFVHLCPFDFTSQGQMANLFKGGSGQTLTLDPAPDYMKPAFLRDLRVAIAGVTAFLPSEEEIRSLFWGETNDLWEMTQRLGEFGLQAVVVKRGGQGQYVYDAVGKKRYEIPAYPARLMDPTGAGSAFCGGFLAGYERAQDPLLAALYGNVSASLKIEGVGPFSPLDALSGLADARLQSLKEMARVV